MDAMWEQIGREAIELRRQLHSHPELSEQEHGTMELLAQKLEALGIPCTRGVADTGLVGLIEGAFDGPTVGLRADIDALPIQEENEDLACRSQVPGVMHACGHDVHTAVLWGTAAVLAGMREKLHGRVKLFFQPAEESIGGAERMIREGVLENPHVDYVLGLHADPTLPAGQIGVKYGKMYAASDMINLKIYGRSCHGAHPSDGVDAILIAAQILTAVQSVVSRNVSPTDSAVCSFGTIQGGNVRNQIADYVEMSGIIRTLDPDTRLFARERVRTICEQTAAMMGGRAEFTVQPSYSPLINDDDMVDLVRQTAAGILGEENVIPENVPSLGVEDFAYFAAARPGCFFHLGCGDTEHPESRVLHSCHFRADERCIPLGIQLQVSNVLRVLETYAK